MFVIPNNVSALESLSSIRIKSTRIRFWKSQISNYTSVRDKGHSVVIKYSKTNQSNVSQAFAPVPHFFTRRIVILLLQKVET